MQPSNEMETVILLATMQEEYGIQIVSAQRPFPDMLIEIDGKQFSVEIEYKASGFLRHKHDPRKCDLVICWKNDIKMDFPLPIIQLANCPTRETFHGLVKANHKDVEIWHLTRRVEILEREKVTRWKRWADDPPEPKCPNTTNDLVKGDPSDPDYILVLHDVLKMELEIGDIFIIGDAVEIWSEYEYAGEAEHLRQMVMAGHLKVQGDRFKLVDSEKTR